MHDVRREAWITTYANQEYNITPEDIEYRFEAKATPEEMQKSRERLAHPKPGEKWYVAKDGTLVVGFCLVINNEGRNKLSSLYVLPRYQGRGIGTALWNKGRTHLDPQRDIEVWTAVYNAKAIAFYKKLGFEETGKRMEDPWLTMKNGAIIPELQLVLKNVQ